MALPRITHLQFLVLAALAGAPTSGRSLRAVLARFRVRKTGPAFYQMMARLEEQGWVEGWYESLALNDRTFRERHYRITGSGRRAWQRCRDFYTETSRLVEHPGAVPDV